MGKEITALKAQKKNPNRINVYLDGEFAFGLARIVAAWLRIGQVLSEDEIARLNHQDTLEVAYQKGLNYLSYRPRSEGEMQGKLRDQGYEEGIITAVIDRMKSNGVLGDQQFAQTWVDNRNAFRPRSKRMLALELRQKGVSEGEIQKALAEVGDETSLAYQVAMSYSRRLASADWETFRKRLGGFLARKGFSYETIAPIISQVWEETHSSTDGENLMLKEDEEA